MGIDWKEITPENAGTVKMLDAGGFPIVIACGGSANTSYLMLSDDTLTPDEMAERGGYYYKVLPKLYK